MMSSMAPLNSLGQDDRNEVQHDFYSHVTQLTLTSAAYDANGIIISIIMASLQSR